MRLDMSGFILDRGIFGSIPGHHMLLFFSLSFALTYLSDFL